MKRTIIKEDSSSTNNSNVELKKLTFIWWAKMLYNQGLITFDACNKAISEYNKMTK